MFTSLPSNVREQEGQAGFIVSTETGESGGEKGAWVFYSKQ